MNREAIDNPLFSEVSEIEDVRIIFKVKGKNYSIIPKSDDKDDMEDARQWRIALGVATLDTHFIVIPSLEEIPNKK